MKITRKEFNELVYLYQELQQTCMEYSDVLNDKAIEDLAYPVISWLEEKLGLQHGDAEPLGDMFMYNEAWVGFDENNEPIFSDDLTEIYDYYIKQFGNEDKEVEE